MKRTAVGVVDYLVGQGIDSAPKIAALMGGMKIWNHRVGKTDGDLRVGLPYGPLLMEAASCRTPSWAADLLDEAMVQLCCAEAPRNQMSTISWQVLGPTVTRKKLFGGVERSRPLVDSGQVRAWLFHDSSPKERSYDTSWVVSVTGRVTHIGAGRPSENGIAKVTIEPADYGDGNPFKDFERQRSSSDVSYDSYSVRGGRDIAKGLCGYFGVVWDWDGFGGWTGVL